MIEVANRKARWGQGRDRAALGLRKDKKPGLSDTMRSNRPKEADEGNSHWGRRAEQRRKTAARGKGIHLDSGLDSNRDFAGNKKLNCNQRCA